MELDEQGNYYPIETQTNQRRSSCGCFLFLLVLILIAVIGGVLWYSFRVYNTPLRASDGSSEKFIIKSGEPVQQVTQDLAADRIITHPTIDAYITTYTGNQSDFKAGTYSVSASMSMHQLVDKFVLGSPKDYYVLTLKEGWTTADIQNYLVTNQYANAADFQAADSAAAQSFDYFGENVNPKNLEGYIFPDTYDVYKTDTSTALISKALANVKTKITPQMLADIKAQGKSVHDILIMASIVEKEVGRSSNVQQQDASILDSERKTVAGIFYNRLALGMPLQSDATIGYVTHSKDPSATAAELQLDSPYNSYEHTGLPPTPISNPSLSSIMAAIYPAKTSYLYFLTKPDGTAVFATTLQQQEQNQALYLK